MQSGSGQFRRLFSSANVFENEKKFEKRLKFRGSQNTCLIEHSGNGLVEFTLQGPNENEEVIDVAIGNYENVIEAALAPDSSRFSWLISNKLSQGDLNEDESSSHKEFFPTRLPAMTGNWKAANLTCSNKGYCGVAIWHTEHVGPNAESVLELIKHFMSMGMNYFEEEPNETCYENGLRSVGRYSWDYFRECFEVHDQVNLEDVQELFTGPHCFFCPLDVYTEYIFPILVKQGKIFDDEESGISNAPIFNQRLYKLMEEGVLAVLCDKEAMFGKVFLHANKQGEWIGARALIVFSLERGEHWSEHLDFKDLRIVE